MIDRPHRTRVHACAHPETFKYFLPLESIDRVWEALANRFGPVVSHATLPLREIDCASFRMRAPDVGTPITVIRTRPCDPDAVNALHAILGFTRNGGDAGDE